MQYKLYFNLQQSATSNAAISFWAREQVKDRASIFFKSCHKFEYSLEAESEWRKLTEIMIDEWNKDILPQTLEAKLIHVVKMIGKTIFSWCMHLKHEFGAENEATNHFDEIQWTPYGTIDEVRTLESFWLKNSDLDITKIYNIACRHAMGDRIDDLWHKLPTDQRNNDSDIYNHFNKHILAYWKHCRDGDLQNLMTCLEVSAHNLDREYRRVFYTIYNLNLSTEENMLRLSVYEGYNMAVQYFWEKLTKEEKDQNILKCARIAVWRNRYYTERPEQHIKHYKRSKYAEICLFLLNHMSDRDKKAFFDEKLLLDNSVYFRNADVKDEILKMLLCLWPWEELFMLILQDMIRYQDNDNNMACKFLDQITYETNINCSPNYAMLDYAMLLREAWIVIPKSIKPKIIPGDEYTGLMNNLVFSRDLDNLKLILNDPAIATVRDTFISYGSYAYEELVENDDFEFLDMLIHEISRSEEEIKQFKQQINAWDRLITNNKFHLADKLLNWQCSTSEERQSIKNGLNSMNFVQVLISHEKYELVNKFLDWRYNTEEEKIKCKDDLKNDTFPIMHVSSIWIISDKDINKAKEESLTFLQLFLKSEEEIVLFKKGIFINFEHDLFTMHRLVRLHRHHILDDFISWCLPNDEQQIQRIKQIVSEFNDRQI